MGEIYSAGPGATAEVDLWLESSQQPAHSGHCPCQPHQDLRVGVPQFGGMASIGSDQDGQLRRASASSPECAFSPDRAICATSAARGLKGPGPLVLLGCS